MLDSLGKQETISLFLYSRGGDIITPLMLCRLIREYSNNFEVLIPYRAHSAGTLICLGADKVVMGSLSELTPIDPSTGHPFKPVDPSDPEKQRRFPISVEDLTSYFLLAREKANVRDEQMVNVFNELSGCGCKATLPWQVPKALPCPTQERVKVEVKGKRL